MTGTAIIIVALIVALVFLVIIVNVMQQQKERQNAERRTEVARQKAIIDETEDVILLSSKMPMSKQLMRVLMARVANALQAWQKVQSSDDVNRRLKDINNQLSNVDKGYSEISERSFQVPDNEQHAIALLQGLKKLRLLIRAEHNKGLVSPSIFVEEEKRIDRLLIRINLENLMSRATSSLLTKQHGSCRQMLDKAETVIANVTVPDEYIAGKIEQINGIRSQLDAITRKVEEENQEKLKRKSDEDDLIFNKKKW
ncbi:hypothetical protein K0504_15395 [Neiella marina]|uniref:DNA repair protein n=1 Tax=Neiella holothuriorum TaxID=2870530 RepID=A0ABS7EJ91_9GAMM|nr:hypothetical protein [Neiella holothuriorum]MBW8192422.1 hypothetical protein [Neiella holothuriorum]